VAEGQRVFHAYAYPGSYIVSLSVGYNYSSGSARMVVEATQAQVALLAEGDGSLLVTNQSDQELNIGLWSLREGGLFVVPEDTLVLPQSGVRFSPQVLGFSGDVGAALYYPNGTLAASAKSSLSSSMRGEPVSTQDMKKYVAQAPLFEAPEGVDIYAPALPASEEGEVLGASDEYFSTEEEKSSSTFWFSLAGLAGVLAAGAVAVHYVRLQQLRRLETSPAAEEFTLE
jgi:hypothetical protein